MNEVSHLVPCNPFGGYKDSGVGREHGRYGFHELTQIKVVSVEKSE
ncbi:MAG: aldehyde dehydrogenase family protein [bacterium]|nr:aldehyde dehydrogenase family protein [bacterium]